MSLNTKKLRQLNIATHRDLGYFLSSLIIVYCLSGLALNHIDDWNPDFIIKKTEVSFDKALSRADINPKQIENYSATVGESRYKVYDFPTDDQVKIYYKDASLHVFLAEKRGVYEQITRRPLFYQTNVLHRNSLKGWKWASDIFAIFLIVVNVTGLFIARGKNSISRRGKWFIVAGFLPVIIGIVIHVLS